MIGMTVKKKDVLTADQFYTLAKMMDIKEMWERTAPWHIFFSEGHDSEKRVDSLAFVDGRAIDVGFPSPKVDEVTLYFDNDKYDMGMTEDEINRKNEKAIEEINARFSRFFDKIKSKYGPVWRYTDYGEYLFDMIDNLEV